MPGKISDKQQQILDYIKEEILPGIIYTSLFDCTIYCTVLMIILTQLKKGCQEKIEQIFEKSIDKHLFEYYTKYKKTNKCSHRYNKCGGQI